MKKRSPGGVQCSSGERAASDNRCMTSSDEWLRVESLDLEAQGVAHNAEGKVVFIEDALPGEEVRVVVRRHKSNWEQAALVEMRRESSQRVGQRCPDRQS